MTSPRPENGSRVRAWDYDFKWTPTHCTAAELRPLVFSYDELATRCLDRFDHLLGPSARAKSKTGKEGAANACAHSGFPDLYELLRTRAPEDDTLQELWDQVNTVPYWVDWDQIERGQRVFYRYAGPSVVGLIFQSLLGGLASARIVETLTRTGGFGVCVARRRLLETSQHILDVTDSLPSIQPGGKGFASSIRVRFLHASVRRRILALARERPTYYSIPSHGIPINDLDSIGTILAFSAAQIWIAFPRQGIFLTAAEIEDYLALWRYVAYLLGVPPTPYLSSPDAARTMMESLIFSELDPSPASQVLANNMLQSMAHQPPLYPSAAFLRAEAHWLNGHALADALAVPRPGVWQTLLVAGQCLVFMAVCYTRRSVRRWDEAGIARARRVLRSLVVKEGIAAYGGGGEAMHELKYVPSLDRIITAAAVGEKRGDQRAGGRVTMGDGVELRNLKAVLVACVVVGWVVGLGVRGVLGMLQKLR
ncbi:uncharacterized protein B0T15DRAFT_248496 [Chaetomium strumarium]|uniref:ER-bound oxygenase mpaB/mpaB'/Rubber oxygenase catalytic domain-containing protein n=1 Tax=Chaetomium strumarium TaxID=1170767 RepID=A0AAJ0GR51_9PEZI|nr:hypothetical protein B0T15DRAFT_248496 [Chaetomium strumarium]